MALVFYAIIILILFVIRKLLIRYVNREKYALPPGPSGWPIIGSIDKLDHLTLWNHRDDYGDLSYINIMGKDVCVLNSANIIREAFLKTPETVDVLSGRPDTFIHSHMIPKDIIYSSIDMQSWKEVRRLFHSLLKQYGDGIHQIEDVVSQELSVVISELKKSREKEIYVSDYIRPSLFNILSILCSGERYSHNDKKLLAAIDYINKSNAVHAPSVDILLKICPWLRFLPVGPGKLVQDSQIAQSLFLKYMLHDFKNLPKSEIDMRKGIVFELLRLQRNNEWLDDEYIEGIIQNTFGAGTLTTYSSLQTFVLIMCHYPEIQNKMKEEIDNVIGDKRRPCLSDRENMPYTQAFILELNRFASVVPMSVPHSALDDVKFQNFTIPKGSIIVPNLFRINHDDSYWDKPWDFIPERFLDENGCVIPATHSVRKNLIAFGVGKRACLGEIFAKTRIFLYVTYILQTFSFKPSADLPNCDPREFVHGITIAPRPFKAHVISHDRA